MPFSPTLFFHICVGTSGLLSGALAMTFLKGSRRHRLAGNVFVLSMLSLSASGTYLGIVKHQILNSLMGVLTFYLVTTAWWTARRRDGKTGIFDFLALMVPLAVGAGLVAYGLKATKGQTAYLIFGSLALFFAAGDVRMLARGGVFGTHRIARHLWRMCFALFIAAGSFFLGQQQVFPAFLRKTNILILPTILPLILMIFWLFRKPMPPKTEDQPVRLSIS
jgi:uncharacterized membrane protein